MKAFSSCPSSRGIKYSLGIQIGTKPLNLAGLACHMSPIPPSMSAAGTGLGIPSTAFTRSLSVKASTGSEIETGEESTPATTEPTVSLGSMLEVSEDLDAILSKIGNTTSTLGCVDASGTTIIEGSRCSEVLVLVDFYASYLKSH